MGKIFWQLSARVMSSLSQIQELPGSKASMLQYSAASYLSRLMSNGLACLATSFTSAITLTLRIDAACVICISRLFSSAAASSSPASPFAPTSLHCSATPYSKLKPCMSHDEENNLLYADSLKLCELQANWAGPSKPSSHDHWPAYVMGYKICSLSKPSLSI